MWSRQDTSVARQLLVWQVVVVIVLVAGGVTLAWLDARADADEGARQRALDLATGVADAPTVREAAETPEPSAVLQPYAEQVRRDTGTDFVTIMDPDGIRWTHPDPDNIGKRFRGSIAPAQQGRSFTEEYTGTLGPSVRAVVPVRDGSRIVGLVSVGIRTDKVSREVVRSLPRLLGAAAAVGVLGCLGAWLIHRRLRRQTHGMGEQEITRMYEYYDAVLRAVREGLVLVDAEGRLSLLNQEATRLLDVDDTVVGRGVDALGLTPELTASLQRGEPVQDAVVALVDRVLVVNVATARWDERDVGLVVTIRDRTELQEVPTELDTVRSLATSLRAQSHESANRLHTILSLVEIGRVDEAVEFGTREMQLAQGLTDRMTAAVEEPIVAALLLGKSAQAAERGVTLELDPESHVDGLPTSAHDAGTVLGNLLDNAIEAVTGAPEARVSVLIDAGATHLDLRVEDSGPGVAPADRDQVFERGWSTKDGPDARGVGLSLVGQVVRRHGGRARVVESALGGAAFEVEIGEDA